MRLFANPGGANYQAQCILAILRNRAIKTSWDDKKGDYLAQPEVGRWENGREQGYVITFQWPEYTGPQLNIAFFEHRNSDSICAVEWVQNTVNTPTIDTMETGGTIYRNKWDLSKTVEVGQFEKMADWIIERLEAHYVANNKTAERGCSAMKTEIGTRKRLL